jgi:hypothetical protein
MPNIKLTDKQIHLYVQSIDCVKLILSQPGFYHWLRKDMPGLVGSDERIRKDVFGPLIEIADKLDDEDHTKKITEFNREYGVNESIRLLYNYLYDHGEQTDDLLLTSNTTTSSRVKKMLKRYIGLTGTMSREICIFDCTLASIIPNLYTYTQIIQLNENEYMIEGRHINSYLTKIAIALLKN